MLYEVITHALGAEFLQVEGDEDARFHGVAHAHHHVGHLPGVDLVQGLLVRGVQAEGLA